MSQPRRLATLVVVASTLLVGASWSGSQTIASAAGAPSVPVGLIDNFIAPVSAPTAIGRLPDGRTLVGSQGGSMSLIGADGVKQASPVLTFGDICATSERGLLGLAVDPAFATNNYIYVYATRDKGSGCQNGVSRFTMSGGTATLATEQPIISHIASTAGNHNGGDIHFGKDGNLYVSVGDGGCFAPGSGCAGGNTKARLSNVMSGKILRVTPDGSIPAGNMFPGGVRCGINGDTTSGQSCAEIYATGLRNPFRIVPDNNAASTRFFINDVGQDSQEEIDELKPGGDYGWNIREGLCSIGKLQPCDTTPPAGITNPLYAYNHFVTDDAKECGVITGGALPPAGWTGKAGSSYLYADFGCERIFEVRDIGGTNTVTTFATGVGMVVDMLMVQETGGWALYYTTYANGGELHRIRATSVLNQPGTGRLVPITPRRVLDTRSNLGSSIGKPLANTVTSFHLPESVVPADATAVAVNVTGVAPASAGFVSVWSAGYPQPTASNLNFANKGETDANAAVLPLAPGHDVNLFSSTSANLIVDVTGYWVPATDAKAGRFIATDPNRILDTRNAIGIAAGRLAPKSTVDLQVTGRGGVPATGVSAVAMVVTSVGATTPGYVTVWPTGQGIPEASSLNSMGGDVRANLVIVPVGANGKVSLFTWSSIDLLADVAGWFTDDSAARSGSGLLQTVAPTRLLDTRDTHTAFSAGETRDVALPIGSAAGAKIYNLTAVQSVGPGFFTAFPADQTLPIASNVNFEHGLETRAALAITKTSAGKIKLYGFAGADILVDAQAYFTA